jgi:uncharacterized membrane protein YedE/YeeE
MRFLEAERWSPYVVGAGIGLLTVVSVLSAGEFLGISTTFVRIAGMAERTIAPAHVAANAYFAKTGLAIDWQAMLVVGVFLGALASSLVSGDRRVERVPQLWKERFGPSRAKRYAAAFAGGALVMFGARMAGGCTSGHGISGALQLALSSWVFLVVVFGSGIATAFLLYGKEGRHV